jgi:hypothetical protein
LRAPAGTDPILRELDEYRAAREAARTARRAEYDGLLSRSAELCPAVAPFCDVVADTIARLEKRGSEGVDPHYSTSIAQWLAGLSRGIKWVETGAEPDFLGYYADTEAFLSDVASEFPAPGNGVAFVGFWVQRADTIAHSPRLRDRVTDCLPEFPGARYEVLDAGGLTALADHFEHALAALDALDPLAATALRSAVATVFVALHKSVKVSLGTRADCFGTVIAGLSPERLDTDNVAATASQLYHEHCHLKLALYLDVTRPDLGDESIYVSPFKNEARDLETMLHTAYTLSIECLTRLSLAAAEEGERHERTLAYLAALAARLDLTGRIAACGLRDDHPAALRSIPTLAADAVAAVARACDSATPAARELHEKERRTVGNRHAWDVGQFLVRDVPVVDPGLDDEPSHDGDRAVSFSYHGQPITARLEAPRESIGDYGRFVEAVL